MKVDWTGLVVVFSVLALLVMMLFWFWRKRTPRSIAQVRVVPQPEAKKLMENITRRIDIGETPDQPVVTIQMLSSPHEYEMAKPLDTQGGVSTSISRLSGLGQVLPSLLVAAAVPGKRLIEVVIHGDLVRAADGNGLRAFTMNAKGIEKHALLFNVSKLQKVINVTAIFSIAAVVVAQKHLADISEKLDEIKDGVFGISRFLHDELKACLRATADFLEQVYQATQGGELSDAARNHLEHCERDLLKIQHQLAMEYREKVARKIQDKQLFGVDELAANIAAKLDELDLLTEEIALCLKTRIAAWHVFSLFPGEKQLKLARRESIQNSIESFQSLGPDCEEKIKNEISNVKAILVGENKLTKRRKELADKCDSTVRTLAQKTQQAKEALERSDRLMLENDRPTRILLQFENGALPGARQG